MNARRTTMLVGLLFLSGLLIIALSFKDLNYEQKLERPAYGGTYVFAIGDKTEILNPQSIVWLSSKNALALIYDPLISVSKDLITTVRRSNNGQTEQTEQNKPPIKRGVRSIEFAPSELFSDALSKVKWHVEERVRLHLRKRHKIRDRGTGYKRFPSAVLYQRYGLFKVPTTAGFAPAHA